MHNRLLFIDHDRNFVAETKAEVSKSQSFKQIKAHEIRADFFWDFHENIYSTVTILTFMLIASRSIRTVGVKHWEVPTEVIKDQTRKELKERNNNKEYRMDSKKQRETL